MDFSELEAALASLIDWIIGSDPEDVTNYVDKIRSENPLLSHREIAEKLVHEQSINNGLLGAVTGAFGLMTLPVTIPADIVKAWKIQAFTIRCIAYVYGYNTQTTDLKTDIYLILPNVSIEQVKQLVIAEAAKAAPKYAYQAVEALKKSAINEAAKVAPKYAAKAITKYRVRASQSGLTQGIRRI